MWIGTHSNSSGIFRLDGEDWVHHSLGPVGTANWVVDMTADVNGDLWVVTLPRMHHFDGELWTVYDQSNSPMPADEVQDIAIRSDGLVAFTINEFGPNTPFPNGVVLFDGENWTVHTFENSPLRHYQLGPVAFDKEGDLWISTISEGVAELDLPPPAVAGDSDGDGDVDLFDFAAFLDCVTGPGITEVPPVCDVFDFDHDRDVDFTDHGALQLAFTGS